MRYLLSCFNRVLAVIVVLGMVVGPSTRAYAGTRLPAVEAEVFPLWIPFAGAPSVNINGELYFNADDGVHGEELWRSDGTEAGTLMVKDIYPDISLDFAGERAAIGNTIYFMGLDNSHGGELWKSDGTEAGTVMVKDIVPGSGGSAPRYLTAMNGEVYFNAGDGVHGDELWKSDGTEAGTTLVLDILPGSAESSPGHYHESMAVMGDHVYFSVMTPTSSWELWKSNGTGEGTVKVGNLAPDSEYIFGLDLVASGDSVFFPVPDNQFGVELWKIGTNEAESTIVKDINPGSGASSPGWLTSMTGNGN